MPEWTRPAAAAATATLKSLPTVTSRQSTAARRPTRTAAQLMSTGAGSGRRGPRLRRSHFEESARSVETRSVLRSAPTIVLRSESEMQFR